MTTLDQIIFLLPAFFVLAFLIFDGAREIIKNRK
jgi:hypothetical protein